MAPTKRHFLLLLMLITASSAAVGSSSFDINKLLGDRSGANDKEILLSPGTCAGRRFGYDSVACACNAAVCDTAPDEPPGGLRPGQVLRVVSARDGRRLQAFLGTLEQPQAGAAPADVPVLSVGGRARARQQMLGWGGAVTDSVALVLRSAPPALRRQALRQLFGDAGARYSFVRVPIAGTDFSTRNYTYDDGDEDPSLQRFALAREDTHYKIPLLHEVQRFVGDRLRLVAAPWSAPAWMVAYDDQGFNHLLPKYNQTWANYFIKFLDSYAKHGLRFWGLTPQNEPGDGYLTNFGINRLGWSPGRMRDWLRDHLGPTLRDGGYSNLKLMVHDDQRSMLPDAAIRTLNDSVTDSFVSGIAIHWYTDMESNPLNLLQTHDAFPDKFLLYTEASDGNFMDPGPSVQLGNWSRAENYAKDIIEATNNWVTGWIDWNVALNPEGGPTWANNTLDATLIVDVGAGEFFKQPAFYALTHFSRWLPPGSLNIPAEWQDAGGVTSAITASAFTTPHGRNVVVLLNRGSTSQDVVVYLKDCNCTYKNTLSEHSITTIVMRPLE